MIRTIKKIDPISYGLIAGLIMAFFGFIAFLFIFLIGTFGGMAAGAGTEGLGMMGGLGVAGLIIAPIMYGIFGFVFAALGAVVFNIASGITGGVKVDIVDEKIYE